MDRDEEPLTFPRALTQPEFWLLMAGAAGASFGLPAWLVVPLVLAGLCVSSLPKYLELRPRALAQGHGRTWWKFVFMSTMSSLAAAVGTFAAGRLTAWLWF